MAWTEAQIISRVATALNDPATAIWGTATIASQLELSVLTISDYSPQLAKGTVAFAGTARELSISTLTDAIEIREVEFPIDKHPRRYVNFTARGSSVILDDYLPSVSTSDTAYVFYAAPHTVSGTATNTLSRQEELIAIELTAADLLVNISRDRREAIALGGGDIGTKYQQDGSRKKQEVMSKLVSLADRPMAIRYPDVK